MLDWLQQMQPPAQVTPAPIEADASSEERFGWQRRFPSMSDAMDNSDQFEGQEMRRRTLPQAPPNSSGLPYLPDGSPNPDYRPTYPPDVGPPIDTPFPTGSEGQIQMPQEPGLWHGMPGQEYDANQQLPVYLWQGQEYLYAPPPGAPPDLPPSRYMTIPTGAVS